MEGLEESLAFEVFRDIIQTMVTGSPGLLAVKALLESYPKERPQAVIANHMRSYGKRAEPYEKMRVWDTLAGKKLLLITKTGYKLNLMPINSEQRSDLMRVLDGLIEGKKPAATRKQGSQPAVTNPEGAIKSQACQKPVAAEPGQTPKSHRAPHTQERPARPAVAPTGAPSPEKIVGGGPRESAVPADEELRWPPKIDPEGCIVMPDTNVMVNYMVAIGEIAPKPGDDPPSPRIKEIVESLSESGRLYVASNTLEELRGVVLGINGSEKTASKCVKKARRLVPGSGADSRTVGDSNGMEKRKDEVAALLRNAFLRDETWRKHVKQKHHKNVDGGGVRQEYTWEVCMFDLTIDKAILAKASHPKLRDNSKTKILMTEDADFLLIRDQILEELRVHVLTPDEWVEAGGLK